METDTYLAPQFEGYASEAERLSVELSRQSRRYPSEFTEEQEVRVK